MDIKIDFRRNTKLGWWHNYNELFDKYFFPGAKVLDLGCGYRQPSRCVWLEDQAACIGIDIDRNVYQQPLRLKVRGDAHWLPFKDCSFDLISSVFVLEHIEKPSKVFSEAFRVLKKGGCFIFITPNFYSFAILMSRLLPQRWHRFIIQNILGKKVRDFDNAPVFYRANSCRKLIKIYRRAGFSGCRIVLFSGLYDYFGSPVIKRVVFKIENLLTDNNILAFLKMHLIFTAKKK